MRFCVEHEKEIDTKLPLWREAFRGMDPAILEDLFRKALRTCKFFPKISEILAPLETVKQAALPEEASEAWQKVLDIRRRDYNPDFPDYLNRALRNLPERIRRPARAAGVFQEISDPDQLHVWGKKRFMESYLNWNELEENQSLLPDGELKEALLSLAELKTLPSEVPRAKSGPPKEESKVGEAL